MRLQLPPGTYDPRSEIVRNGQIERALAEKQSIGAPVILRAPDGSKWKLVVDNSGNLSAEAL